MGERDQLRNEEQDVAQRQDKKDEEAQLQRPEGSESEHRAQQYESTVAAMAHILSAAPGFKAPESMPPEITAALEQLFEAKTAVRESIGDGHVSGMARMKSLNLALARLRPVLSAGLKPGVDDAAREALGEKVGELRREIKQTIYKEAVPRLKRKKKGDDEAGDEDDPSDDDEDDDNYEDEASR